MSSSGSSGDVYAETLAVFDQRDDPCEPLTTPEVADSLNTARRTVYKRLEKLVNRGDLQTKKAGANARVWWQPASELPSNERREPHVAGDESRVPIENPPVEQFESEHIESELSENKAWLSEVLAQLPTAAGLINTDGIFELQNNRMEEAVAGNLLPSRDSDQHDTWIGANDDGERLSPEQWPGARALRGEDISDGIEFRLERNETSKWMNVAAVPFRRDGDVTGAIMTVEDITDRVEREWELQQYETIVETVDDGVYALDSDERFVLVNGALCEMTGYSREELLGAHPTLINSTSVNESANRVSEQITEGAVDSGVLEFDIEHADGTTVPIESRFAHYETEEGTGARCGVVRDISERKERERTLESQRQRLSTVNEIHNVVQDVTHLVIEQSTREEIEQTVCEAFVDSNYYDFAWIGRVSRNGSELSVHVSSGTETSHTAPLRGEESTDHGPIAQAVKTQSIQSPVGIFEDPAFDDWTTDRDRRDHNAHVIPITYDGRGFGVLTVYTERSVIRNVERELLQQVGEIIGHAVMTVEQEQALLADQVIEVEYISEALAERFIAASDGEIEISVDRTILLSNREALHYLTLRGITPDEYRTVVDDIPSVVGVRVLLEESDLSHVEVQVEDDTISAVMTTYNGRLMTATHEAGEFRIVAELPLTVNLREITDKLEGFYPDIELIGQKTVTRQQLTNLEHRTLVDDSLTNRQRTTLEAAYASGYFEWPRKITAEELADLLGIHPSTLHQHLRRAEKKLVSPVFDFH